MLSEHAGTFGLLVKLGALQCVVGVVTVKLYEYETGGSEAPGAAVIVLLVMLGTAAIHQRQHNTFVRPRNDRTCVRGMQRQVKDMKMLIQNSELIKKSCFSKANG